ncbi:MAG: hypothetical protein O3B47_03865 [bacterium]|nr:hypothetical protein [bacterium]
MKNNKLSLVPEHRQISPSSLSAKLVRISPSSLSDKDLLNLASRYGGNAKNWLRQFAGLLPEIFRRKLFKSSGFASIHHYAKMVAGMNEMTVDKVLRLGHKLQDKPALLRLFESGKEGWSKLEKVSGIATLKNDAELAEMLPNISTRALEGYVKGKRVPTSHVREVLESPIPTLNNDLLYRQIHSTYNFRLSIVVMRKLRTVKQILEKQRKEILTWNKVFKYWCADNGGSQENKITLMICADCAQKKGKEAKTRAIPIDVQRLIRVRYGDTCPFAGCERPWTHFHHQKRYAICKNHDPDYIVPLCKVHHDSIHDGFIANEHDPPWKWYFRDHVKLSNIDKKVRAFKKSSIVGY